MATAGVPDRQGGAGSIPSEDSAPSFSVTGIRRRNRNWQAASSMSTPYKSL
ncbi:hypothetical protein CLOM621_07158 [Clostridium sp. M62/1]|nr:hypothetical protein CLOM621_07158 [Clostridium sp. M62/1]